MSGQLLLLLLTSVLASDETSISGNQHSSSVSQTELLSAAVAEESQARKKAVQLSETQKALMTHLELPDNWTFWFHDDSIQTNEQRETISPEEWLQTLQKMESFRNYGQFLNQVKTFKNGSIPLRIYLFKNNIRPSWEEEANKDGGRLLICLPEERDPLRAFEAFLKVAVKVMCSDIGARVNGTTFAYRPECGTTISVWTPVIWTPQRDKEEFNRFKKLIYEEEIQGPLKVLFRPHKTYSVNTKHNAGANRRPYRQGPIKPPPGFEGSALSSQWFNQTPNDKAAPVVVAVPTPRLDEEAAKQKEEEDQRQREAEALKLMLAAKEEEEKRLLLEQQKKEEAKARKMARRQRQKENRKKRKASSASTSSSNSEASSEDEELSEEEEEVVAVAVADEEPQEEAEPEESIPAASPSVSGYSKFLLPAVATVSTVVLAAAPFAFQYLF